MVTPRAGWHTLPATVTITAHAADQMKVRGIDRAWVEATLSAPEATEPDPRSGRVRLFRAVPEFGGRVLRVVVERRGHDVEVVTVHFDRSATRRSRGR